MPEIIPAIIAKDFEDLKNKIKLVEPYVKTVQLDIMDGVFVANKTWNKPEELASLETNLFLEVHLMVAEPEKVTDGWLASKVSRVIVHYEAIGVSVCHSRESGNPELWIPPYQVRGKLSQARNDKKEKSRNGNDIEREADIKIKDFAKKVKKFNKEFGIALNPETPIGVLDDFVGQLDLVLLMSVNPGFAGQPFQESVIPKIAALRQKYPDVKIGVDGGINLQNVKKLVEAGADFLAVGSAIFESENPAKVINQLKEAVR